MVGSSVMRNLAQLEIIAMLWDDDDGGKTAKIIV